MTIDEAIEREEALAYSFGERYKRLGEPVGELDKLEAEHQQFAKWLRELKAYREADKEMRGFLQAWEEGAGIQRCIETIDKYIDKVVTIKDLEWRE